MFSEVERKVYRISIKTTSCHQFVCYLRWGESAASIFKTTHTLRLCCCFLLFLKNSTENFSPFLPSIISSRKVKENCTAALEKNTFNDTKYARKAAQLPPRCESNYSKQIINDVESCLIPAAHSATSYTPPPCRSLRFFFFDFHSTPSKSEKKTRRRERKINQQTITTSQNFLTHSTRTAVAAGFCAEI